MSYKTRQEILSLLNCVKYKREYDITYDYSKIPRPCHNLVFLLEGECVVTTNEQELHVQAGDILYIPKNTTYTCSWRALPKQAHHTLHFAFQPKLDPLFNKQIPIQRIPAHDFQDLYALLQKINDFQYAKDEQSFFALSAFFELYARVFSRVRVLQAPMVSKTISPAIRYIEEHYAEKMSVETLASLCFLSESRFYYLFKKQVGISPIVYKNRVAVQYAAQDLLHNPTDTVETVAERNGFVSLIYFERQFKKLTGKTPSQYRKETPL